MRFNKDNKRQIYVNPINHTSHTGDRLCSCVALQSRLGLLSKWWIRDDIVNRASAVAIGRDLAMGVKRR